VFCNRGTSGIDGSTSTAIGALSLIKLTVLLPEILGFVHSNALWNNYIPKKFKIILINNGGGGILEFYQVMKKPCFLILILKPHIV
jgi:2-succinyl-5-enolpyruvyl-6-hydroxy-3-cyclohexene-1-carboxylate synthase